MKLNEALSILKENKAKVTLNETTAISAPYYVLGELLAKACDEFHGYINEALEDTDDIEWAKPRAEALHKLADKLSDAMWDEKTLTEIIKLVEPDFVKMI